MNRAPPTGAVLLALLLAAPLFGAAADPAPLTWPHCLDIAIKHNADFQLAQVRLLDTEGIILSKQANFLPKVQAGGVTLPPTLVVGFIQPIYSTAMAPASRSYPVGRSAARVNAQLALLELVYQMRTSFARALYTDRLAEIYRRDLDILKDRLRRAPSLFDAEKMRKSDVAELEVRVTLAEERLSRALKERDLARLDLIEIMGVSASHQSVAGRPAGAPEERMPPDLDINRLTKRALENRLDLQLARKLKLLADEMVVITRAPSYPSPGVFGNNILTTDPPHFLKPLTDAMDPQSAEQDEINRDIVYARATYGLGVTWRLFDGGDIDGKVVAAKADAVKQEVLVRNLERTIPLQVEQAVKALQSVLKLSERMNKSSFRPANIETLQKVFEAGQTSQIEILDAVEQTIRFEEAKLALSHYLSLALAALDRATGDGIQILNDPQQARAAQKIPAPKPNR